MQSTITAINPETELITDEIIRVKGRYWEFKLFSQLLINAIYQKKNETLLLVRTENSIPASFFIDNSVSFKEYLNWLILKTQQLPDLMNTLATTIVQNKVIAFGPKCETGNADEIIKLVTSIKEHYKNVLRFIREIQSHRVEFGKSTFSNTINSFSHSAFSSFRDSLILEGNLAANFYENLGPEIATQIARVLEMEEVGIKQELNINFSHSISVDALSRELNSMTENLREFCKNIPDSEEEENNPTNPDSGSIYLLMNPSMPGLFKIGKTTRETGQRIKELNSATGVPTSFVLVYETFVSDCHAAERYVHDRLDVYRVSNNREFFKLASSTAIDVILEAKGKFQ